MQVDAQYTGSIHRPSILSRRKQMAPVQAFSKECKVEQVPNSIGRNEAPVSRTADAVQSRKAGRKRPRKQEILVRTDCVQHENTEPQEEGFSRLVATPSKRPKIDRSLTSLTCDEVMTDITNRPKTKRIAPSDKQLAIREKKWSFLRKENERNERLLSMSSVKKRTPEKRVLAKAVLKAQDGYFDEKNKVSRAGKGNRLLATHYYQGWFGEYPDFTGFFGNA